MPRATFTQAAVKRAVLAMEAIGKTVRGVEVKRDGSILVLVDTGGEPLNTPGFDREVSTCDEAFGCDT
jgi:glucose/arabinose dehydrogenase